MMSKDTLHFHRRADDDCPEAPIPAGMTQEQLGYFTDQTERAVGKGVRRFRNAAVVGYGVLCIGLIFVWLLFQADLNNRRQNASDQRAAIVSSGRAVATNSCNQRYADRVALRGLLLTSEQLTVSEAKKGHVTPEQAAVAKDYYEKQLRRLRLPDCRKDANLLTSDPVNAEIVIAPFYPGAKYAPKDVKGG